MASQEDLPLNRSRSLSPSPQHEQSGWVNDEEDAPLHQAVDSHLDCGHQQLPKPQPEDDDVWSTSSSSSCSTNAENDLTPDGPAEMKYSLTSNLLFLAGASVQTFVAVWEVQDAIQDAAWDAAHENTPAPTGDDDYSSDDDDEESYALYFILNSIGPFLFMLNALVDAKLSLTLPSNHPLATTAGPFHILQHAWKKPHTASNNPHDDDDDTSIDQEEMQRDIKEKWGEFIVAAIFGLGATLEFCSTLFEFGSSRAQITGSSMSVVAMHTYLISGLLHLQKDRRFVLQPGGSCARKLMGCGMIMFLTGSILDCIMSYLYDPELVSDDWITPLTLAWCNLASSILWNIDAIFFVWADYLLYNVGSCCKQRLRLSYLRMRQRIEPPPPLPSPSANREGVLVLPLLHVMDVVRHSQSAQVERAV